MKRHTNVVSIGLSKRASRDIVSIRIGNTRGHYWDSKYYRSGVEIPVAPHCTRKAPA